MFLSEVDPYNIPADHDIKFDTQKVLKIVGKEGKQKQLHSESPSENSAMS